MAQQALLDTSVLQAAFYGNDQFHDRGLEIVQAADDGDLPTMVVLDFILAELLNGLTGQVEYEECKRALELLEKSAGFRLDRTPNQAWIRGRSVYGEQAHLSLVDSVLVAYARGRDLPYLYSFDTGFDSADGVTRIPSVTNPYEA